MENALINVHRIIIQSVFYASPQINTEYDGAEKEQVKVEGRRIAATPLRASKIVRYCP